MNNLIGTVRDKLSQIRQKSLFKDSAWMLIAQGSGIFIQAAYFIILARVLGPEDYGAFVGIAALATMLGPFASWGSANILVKNVSRDNSLLSLYWGNSLFVIAVSSFLITLVCLFIAPSIFPEKATSLLIILIFGADLVGLRIIETTSAAFIATGQVKRTAQIKVLLAVSKLMAAIGLAVFFKNVTPVTWAFLYCLSTVFTALISAFMVNVLLAPPKVSLSKIKSEFLEGFNFSISHSAEFVNANIDRTMLASLSTLQATGVYGAGYRFIEVCCVPINAVSGASYARFFQAGVAGIKGSWGFAKRLLPLALGYGVVVAVFLVMFAPFAPWVIGEEYQEAVPLIRMLAVVPGLVAAQYIAGDTLTCAGFQGIRSGAQVCSAALNISLNFYLIPIYSWRGAVWATLSSETFKLVVALIAIAYLLQQQKKEKRTF